MILVMKWLQERKNFLLFQGVPGCGKTHFTRAVFNYLSKDKFYHVRRWREGDLLSRIRASMEQPGDYIETLKYLIDDECIILDDLGSAGLTDWRKDTMLEFVDLRYESQKPTLITTNFNNNEIMDAYGKRFYSRLFCDETTVLEFGSVDWRRIEQMNAETKLREAAELLEKAANDRP